MASLRKFIFIFVSALSAITLFWMWSVQHHPFSASVISSPGGGSPRSARFSPTGDEPSDDVQRRHEARDSSAAGHHHRRHLHDDEQPRGEATDVLQRQIMSSLRASSSGGLVFGATCSLALVFREASAVAAAVAASSTGGRVPRRGQSPPRVFLLEDCAWTADEQQLISEWLSRASAALFVARRGDDRFRFVTREQLRLGQQREEGRLLPVASVMSSAGKTAGRDSAAPGRLLPGAWTDRRRHAALFDAVRKVAARLQKTAASASGDAAGVESKARVLVVSAAQPDDDSSAAAAAAASCVSFLQRRFGPLVEIRTAAAGGGAGGGGVAGASDEDSSPLLLAAVTSNLVIFLPGYNHTTQKLRLISSYLLPGTVVVDVLHHGGGAPAASSSTEAIAAWAGVGYSVVQHPPSTSGGGAADFATGVQRRRRVLADDSSSSLLEKLLMVGRRRRRCASGRDEDDGEKQYCSPANREDAAAAAAATVVLSDELLFEPVKEGLATAFLKKYRLAANVRAFDLRRN